MEKTILFPLIGFVVFISKLIGRGVSTIVMFLDWTKQETVNEFSFAKRANKATFANNLSAKTGTKEYKRIKKSMDLL